MKDKDLARISPAEAKRFLTELANLSDDAVGRFQKRFGDRVPNNNVATFVLTSESFTLGTEEQERQTVEAETLGLRNLLRRIWIEPDLRTKRYGVFLLWKRSMFSSLTWVGEEIPFGLPPPSPFEQAIQVLIDAAELARYCGNPECFTPYFFASRRSQKYCSDACALPAQKEFKRQWWSEHGEEWRAKRSHVKSSAKTSQKPSKKNPHKKGRQ
jgi:hypothetical protein